MKTLLISGSTIPDDLREVLARGSTSPIGRADRLTMAFMMGA